MVEKSIELVLSRDSAGLINTKHHAHKYQHSNQKTSSITHKWQRNSCYWKQSYAHSDIDEHMNENQSRY